MKASKKFEMVIQLMKDQAAQLERCRVSLSCNTLLKGSFWSHAVHVNTCVYLTLLLQDGKYVCICVCVACVSCVCMCVYACACVCMCGVYILLW